MERRNVWVAYRLSNGSWYTTERLTKQGAMSMVLFMHSTGGIKGKVRIKYCNQVHAVDGHGINQQLERLLDFFAEVEGATEKNAQRYSTGEE